MTTGNRVSSLDFRIAQLETTIRRMSPGLGGLVLAFSTGSCTSNCTASCTMGCTGSSCTSAHNAAMRASFSDSDKRASSGRVSMASLSGFHRAAVKKFSGGLSNYLLAASEGHSHELGSQHFSNLGHYGFTRDLHAPALIYILAYRDCKFHYSNLANSSNRYPADINHFILPLTILYAF